MYLNKNGTIISIPIQNGTMTSGPLVFGKMTRVPRQFGTMTCTKGIGTATSVHVKRKVYIITSASGTKTSVPINVPQEFWYNDLCTTRIWYND